MKDLIISRLSNLTPNPIKLVDESHLHHGHQGAANGAKHFRLFIVSEQFEDLNAVERHRIIFKQLSDLIPFPLHALAIHAFSPAEYLLNKPF